MTYQETLAYIHNINWCFCNPGLERIRELCDKLGHPEKHLRFVHVAGTNGKGSFCAMLDSILRAAGYRVGLFTSPYIRTFNERMQINGRPIADEELCEIVERVRPIADAMEQKPTEFELITAVAFEYFYRQKTDVVILEVGLGGRLDSTNIIENPLLSVITGIHFDHLTQLGNTLQAIAAEKAGIIKEGRPILFGGEATSCAHRTVGEVAKHRHAPFYCVDRSTCRVNSYSLERTLFDYKGYKDLELALLGTYQPHNAATVLDAVELLREQGMEISEQNVRQGLASVRWPARFELLSKDPTVLYDGGHNPQGVSAAVKSIKAYFPEQTVNILSGVMADKAYDEMIETLRPVTAKAFTVTPDNPRALSAKEYATYLQVHKIEASAYESVEEALRAALADCRKSGRPLICLGSLYLYQELSAVAERVLSEKAPQ